MFPEFVKRQKSFDEKSTYLFVNRANNGHLKYCGFFICI